ncbi:MAG: serine/threonine-protein phosphatase [Clostridia bacterium]|nr:serine/threonine-protein phosphatase [Clostridia bacterium]
MWIGVIVLAAVIAGGVLYALGRRKKRPVQQETTYEGGETVAADTAPTTEMYNGPQIAQDGWPILRVGTSSIVGKRKNQQDALYCSEWKNRASLVNRGLLAAVADGIGGLSNGDLASVTVVQNIRSSFLAESAGREPAEELLYAAASAHRGVLELNREGKMCGSTLVSVLIRKWSLWLLSIGDSRIALYRAGVLLTLNREHIMKRDTDEQSVFSGAPISSDARKDKALTAFVGKENLRQIDRTLTPMRLLPGDKIVLMSDGIFGTVSEDEMCAALACAPEEAARKITALVEAKNKSAQDNASIIVIGVSIA